MKELHVQEVLSVIHNKHITNCYYCTCYLHVCTCMDKATCITHVPTLRNLGG